MISNGTFKDLFIGDYFHININTGDGGEEIVVCIFAGFDSYLRHGDHGLTTHHAVIVTKNCLNTEYQMNSTNITNGGFVGSDMWTNVIPIYNAAFGDVFGNHLLTHRTFLTNAIDSTLSSNAGNGFTGCASGCVWTDTQLSLLSEIQVFGTNISSSSFFDDGCDNSQLPLFALDQSAKICSNSLGRKTYWLKNIASSSSFVSVLSNGASSYQYAANSRGIRPVFLIG